MSIQCPACHAELKTVAFHGIEVDTCESCQGIWFDFTEMKMLCDSDTLEHIETAFPGQYHPEATKREGEALACPRDGKPLTCHQWADDSGILMDFCEFCSGTWLDAGELEQYTAILKNLKDNPPVLSDEAKADIQRLDATDAAEVKAWKDKYVSQVTPAGVLRNMFIRLSPGMMTKPGM